MGTSTIPVILAGLVGDTGLLKTAAGLAGVQVHYGAPRDMERDWVVMPGMTSEWDQEWATLQPAHPRDEAYTLDLVVGATTPGDTAQQAVERAFALLAVVETTLRPAPNQIAGLGAGQKIRDFQVTFRSLVVGWTEEGYGCEIQAGVRVAARI